MKYRSLKGALSAAAGTCLFGAAILFAQSDLPPIDESQFSDNPTASPPVPVPDSQTQTPETPKPDLGPEPVLTTESEPVDLEGGVQNAVIEGVQISSEPGDKPDEKVISCYFIFKDKPSSYFYEVRQKEKKIIFEFNDTKTGTAPIPTVAEPPITGFSTEQRKIDINKDVKGLKPEWHTQVRVIFSLNQVPEIHVSDEYNVISFSYKWTTDPGKEENYVIKEKGPVFFIASGATVGVVGLGVLAWYLWFKPKPQPLGDIPVDDLPSHSKQ